MRKRLRAVWGLIIVGVVAACALGPVPEMRESLYPEMPNQSPLIGSSPTATESDSSVTPFAPPSATLLPSPTPTVRPYVVAVATGLYAESMELWTDIEARVDRCIVIMEDGSDNQARLLWTWQTEPNDTVLGAEPHLWVSHHDANVSDVTWPALGEMAESGWTLLAPDGCSSLLSERLPDVSVDTSLLSADAAHRAARDRRALALVPWRAVGVEMRTLPFDGERFDPRDTTAWPILRSLVLRGKEPPEGLVQALGELAPASFPGVELVGVGDIMLARSVGDEIAIQGACYPYGGEGIADLLQGADVAFGNLECVVSTGGVRQNKAYTFRANPATLEGLAWAGFDVVALANNHTCDYGRDAVVDTVSNVVEAGILAAGAGENLDRASGPVSRGQRPDAGVSGVQSYRPALDGRYG